MELSYIEKHVATKNLEYKGGSGAAIYFTTVLRHEPITIFYNVAGRSIVNVICFQELEEEDIDFMESALTRYLYENFTKLQKII